MLVGTVVGILTGNAGLWIGVGIAIGAGVGVAVSAQAGKRRSP